MSDYQTIFETYISSENIPFKVLNKRVIFPDDLNSPIYTFKNITANTPWTVLSYQLYGTIDYWWLLCAVNKNNNMYYAQDGTQVAYIKAEYIPLIENSLK
jgi:hypothetical protein